LADPLLEICKIVSAALRSWEFTELGEIAILLAILRGLSGGATSNLQVDARVDGFFRGFKTLIRFEDNEALKVRGTRLACFFSENEITRGIMLPDCGQTLEILGDVVVESEDPPGAL